MEIVSFTHAGLKKLYRDDDKKGVHPAVVDKLRKMLAFLQDMESVERLSELPGWGAHQLKGDRKGTWSLKVTGNYRLTFLVAQNAITDLNLEDYH